MAYGDVSTLMTTLRADNTIAARALEFCILTATRTGEILGALLAEGSDAGGQSLDGASLPERRPPREHRVPLSDGALAILEGLSQTLRTSEFILLPTPARAAVPCLTLQWPRFWRGSAFKE